MIVKLDISPEQAATIDQAKMALLLCEVARAYREGFHRIALPRQLAKWLDENINLNDIDRSLVKKMASEYAQTSGLHDEAFFKISVVHINEPIQKLGTCNWNVNIEYLLENRLLNPTTFLVENPSVDGKFYDITISALTRRLSFGKVCFTLHNGGGGGIAQEFIRLTNEGRPCVAVVDSDMRHPFADPPDSIRKIRRVLQNDQFIRLALATPCHELENFLPLSIVGQLSSNANLVDLISNCLNNQAYLSSVQNDCFWLYFDLKDGIRRERFSEHYPDKRSQSWLASKIGIDVDELKDYSCEGFGDNLIGMFLNSGKLLGDFHQFVRSEYWDKHFFAWFLPIVHALCGGSKVRVS